MVSVGGGVVYPTFRGINTNTGRTMVLSRRGQCGSTKANHTTLHPCRRHNPVYPNASVTLGVPSKALTPGCRMLIAATLLPCQASVGLGCLVAVLFPRRATVVCGTARMCVTRTPGASTGHKSGAPIGSTNRGHNWGTQRAPDLHPDLCPTCVAPTCATYVHTCICILCCRPVPRCRGLLDRGLLDSGPTLPPMAGSGNGGGSTSSGRYACHQRCRRPAHHRDKALGCKLSGSVLPGPMASPPAWAHKRTMHWASSSGYTCDAFICGVPRRRPSPRSFMTFT